MNPLKKLSIFVLMVLLFTACKKVKFESTGKLELTFKNGIPTCYTLYTEESYSTSRLAILTSGGTAGTALDVTFNGNTMTIKGLNYGTYVFNGCAVGTRIVQVSAGATKTYDF